MPLGGGGGSLLDDLADCADDDSDVGGTGPAAAAAVEPKQHAATTAQIRSSIVSLAPDAVDIAGQASSPLAAYLQRLAQPDQAEPQLPASTVAQHAASDNEDGSIESAAERPNSPVRALPAGHARRVSSSAAVEASSSGGAAAQSALLLLELAAPALFALARPAHTLSSRSRRWCVRTCLVAVAAAATHSHDSEEGEAEDAALQRDAQRLPMQRQQLVSQLHQLRLLHSLSLGCAVLCASFFLLQLLLAFLGRLGVGVLLPLLLGAQFDAAATVAAVSSSTDTAAVPGLLPFVYLLGAALSLLNVAAAWRSWNSCADWHGATASLLHVLHDQRATMLASRRLLLQLMERELVRRGYQLAAPSSSSSSSTRTIERLDQAKSSRRMAAAVSLDTSLRIRASLQRVLQQQQDATAAFTDALVQCSAQLDGGGSFSAHSVQPTATTSSLDASSSSLSLVQLKSCRTAWLHNYDTALRCLRTLLHRLDDDDHQHFFALLGPASSLEQSLAQQLQQLHILTAQHATILQSLFPSAPSSSELPFANASSAGPNVASNSLQSDALALLATLSSSHPRRGVHSALQEARFVARSAERRMQLSLEQQWLPQPPCVVEDFPDVAAEAQESSGWHAQLRAALALPALLNAASPCDSFTKASSSKPCNGASQVRASLTPWDGAVSAALQADGAYLRQLAAQLRAHADTLEAQRRRLDAEHGLGDDAGEQQPHMSESTSAPLRPVALASSSSSSVANADNVDNEVGDFGGGRGADAAVSKSELMAALSAMRNKTPAGMGALFEGEGQVDADAPFRPRRTAAPTARAGGGTAAAAPVQPAVSIFTVLSELKNVLRQRPTPYEYFTHAQPAATAAVPAAAVTEGATAAGAPMNDSR